MQFISSPISPPRTAVAPVRSAALPGRAYRFEATRNHLSNLDFFLQKQSPPTPEPPPQRSKTRSAPKKFLKSISIPFFRSNNNGGGGCGEEIEMSPRSLTRLHRLLSDSSGPSPRKTIAHDWRSYHGSGNWDGLLNPLEDNLRRELVRYGDFVGAAYHAFNSDPGVPAGSHRQVALPDKSYKVTRGLHATASVAIPRWAQSLLPPWMSQRTSWVGYVAVCESESEIKRMGRRDIVVALRGTATCLEWAENFRAALFPAAADEEEHSNNNNSTVVPKVECGFWSLYKTRGEGVPSLSEAVREEVCRLLEKYKGEQLSITVTGHSLGAALAVLVADELSAMIVKETPPVAVFSFGGPRVGNKALARRVEARGVKVLRVVNAHDVVTRVPTMITKNFAGDDGYADVGRELRLDSRASPYLRPDADPVCCHDLEAYLHVVDGYIAANCPFRANAKRSLVRLLNQQSSNVKKLYVSKALALGIDGAAAQPQRPRPRPRDVDKPRRKITFQC